MRRRTRSPAPVQWPPWVWGALTNSGGYLADTGVYEWCAEMGYDRLQVQWVASAHRRAAHTGPHRYWLRCPCPLHSDGSPFPSPAELERRWRR